MPKLYVTIRDGSVIEINAETGLSVMENIRNASIDGLPALCGGCCSCATCHVIIDEPWFERVNGISEDERSLLDEADHRQPTSRLSCQIEMQTALDGLCVTIAPEA